jgi:two-component system sensor histidine kinase DesK
MGQMTSSSAQRLAGVLITAVSVAYAFIGLIYFSSGPRNGFVATAALVGVVVTHYMNMRAGLRGGRPPLFPLTLVLQAVCTYVPDWLLPNGWSSVAAPMLAGTLLVFLPLRWGGPLVGAMTLWQGGALLMFYGNPVIALFYGLSVATTGAMIYAMVRFVRVTADLEDARAELAEAAVLKERLRISRDLHDGLGRSLTAIALKGDLAARLMERDPAAARGEMGELVQVAREAVQDVRQVVRGYRRLSLGPEVDRAATLLESSGVGCQVHLAEAAPPKPSEEALAWGVREAVTNVLRHSRATTCTITTSLNAGTLRLEIVNDGAFPASGDIAQQGSGGGGLAGLAERAAQVGGTLAAGPSGAGGFRLTMEVPA